MRNQKPLKSGTKLNMLNNEGVKLLFFVDEVIGTGGSCIVYQGHYFNSTGSKKSVRIKECYPFKLNIIRNEEGHLLVNDKEIDKFEEYKSCMKKAFGIAHRLHETSGMTNSTSDLIDIYEANNTIYVIMSCTEGKLLSESVFNSLDEVIRVTISVSKSIEKIHNLGYLYLDIKPENILMYNETPDLVQLFDFDSLIPIEVVDEVTKYRISFTDGFAPVEQKMGDLNRIGKTADVYAIGALLFYLIFGRTPTVRDYGTETKYDYSQIVWYGRCQKRVYKELDVFFNNTLKSFYKDRYQSMSETVCQLEEILKYALLPKPFICSGFVTNQGEIIGRKEDCKQLMEWYLSDEKFIFLTGRGGIGKSTIVRKFIMENDEHFENMIYLKYKETIQETISDDVRFRINGCERDDNESLEEYFQRKLKSVSELINERNTLLVIDNFDGNIDEEFLRLIDVGWKIIVVTRMDMSNRGYPHLSVEKFNDKKDIYRLFEANTGHKLRVDEYHMLDHIIEISAGHTLILVLIAKQISKSCFSMEEAYEMLLQNHFSDMASEKIEYMQDGELFYDHVSKIIRALFDLTALSEEKRKYLKILSVFGVMGVSIREFQNLLKLDNLDEINELAGMGWLEISEKTLQMHPLVQEIIHQIEWNDECRNIVINKMICLFKQIKKYKEYNKFDKDKQDADIYGEHLQRMINKKDENKNIYHMFQNTMEISKTVLRNCVNESIISNNEAYKDLSFIVLINTTKDNEKYILHNSKNLFADEEYRKNNPYKIIDLYDYVVYVLCQKPDFCKVQKYLSDAKAFAKQHNKHYIWAKYYDMLSDFYDTLLDGAYYSDDTDEQRLNQKLLRATEKCIYHMRNSQHNKAHNLYIKYLLDKANLMIRTEPEKKPEIRDLLVNIKKLMDKYTTEHSMLRAVWYLSLAWYYTLCEADEEVVCKYLKKCARINEYNNISDMDKIDYYYIPAANMMCEIYNDKKAMNLLCEAVRLCRKHEGVMPYMRKYKDLLRYMDEIKEG